MITDNPLKQNLYDISATEYDSKVAIKKLIDMVILFGLRCKKKLTATLINFGISQVSIDKTIPFNNSAV